MIEQTMLHIIILLLTAWIITTIIAFALIIALAIVISKKYQKHIAASRWDVFFYTPWDGNHFCGFLFLNLL